MAIIYMAHPKHGAKVAIDEAEATYDEAYGWVRVEIETFSVELNAADDDDEDEVVNALAAPKRRGRPRSKQED